MINENNKLFFIVNKYSGSGFDSTLERLVMNICKQNNTHCALAYTQSRGHATTLAAEAILDGFSKIVAVGGDGTVNEVAQALTKSSAALGIIPKGSGNGLARHLRIPVRFERALQCLFTAHTVEIDTLRLNGKLSLNVSGIGFDGFVAERFGANKQRGLQGYTKLVLNEFRAFQEFEATIRTGDRTVNKKAFVIAIANSSQYGNNARIAPRASVCDGLIDIAILRKMPPYRLDFIYSLFAGTLDQSAYCDSLQIPEATITLGHPMYFHIDGEPAGHTDRLDIALNPKSLRVIAPSGGV